VTAEEMILAAIKRDFVSIGFSAHSPLGYPNEWSLQDDKVDAYIAEIHVLQAKYSGQIEVLCGIELDYDCTIDTTPFSHVIGAVHNINKDEQRYSVDASPERLQKCIDEAFDGDTLAMCEFYYDSVVQSSLRPNVNAVAHFDLVTKFIERGVPIDQNHPLYQAAALGAVDAILDARPGMIFEVNTGGMYRAGRSEPYPAKLILEHLVKRGAQLVLTSDAHDVAGLDYGYENALALCSEVGFTSILRLRAHGFENFKI